VRQAVSQAHECFCGVRTWKYNGNISVPV